MTKYDESVIVDIRKIAQAVRVHLAEENCTHNIRTIVGTALEEAGEPATNRPQQDTDAAITERTNPNDRYKDRIRE